MKKNLKVSASIKANRINIVLTGSLSKQDMEAIYTELRFCVADLTPGFSVVTDYSKCKIAHLAGLKAFKRIGDHLAQHQVGLVIRVIHKQQLVFSQLSRVADRFSKYEAVYVSTMADAEAVLADAVETQRASG